MLDARGVEGLHDVTVDLRVRAVRLPHQRADGPSALNDADDLAVARHARQKPLGAERHDADLGSGLHARIVAARGYGNCAMRVHLRRSLKDDAGNAKLLARVTLDGNRRLLARVPIDTDANGEPILVRQAADGRRAMRLKGDAQENQLTKLLADDPHVGPFLAIPGKDNGFDIEGLAVIGSHLLLGLRGPVLRGWTLLLELCVQPSGDWLRLVPLDDDGTLVRKRFLQLGGLGVRDLHVAGDDLFILAGPTMVLDGDIRLIRWPGALGALKDNRAAVRFQETFDAPVELPHARGGDRAEAFCEAPEVLQRGKRSWLVLHDAPSEHRLIGEHVVLRDLLRLE
ncbi:DUF3616 domain-containing protein [Aquincola sp. S2]|uniref:DUF3616 domain-containing protein n=2 Tax=Pseudaquabacterium terrae TaxID=2732868 RepID=A0ABX2EQ00_9BURK|nr:DUF3616 domain-containing protein [Aquabacterium terrae]